jgi:diacylglycerol O-acyltransferase / wax synthase
VPESELTFARDMEPVEFMMFKGEQDPRARSGMLSVALLDVVPDFERFQAAFERASRVVLRLRQHVVVPALPIGAAQWVVDPDFDLDYHVRRVGLPAPGTIRHLLDFAQVILAAPFDVGRPLWEAHLVEGITEGDAPAALLLKLNHAVTDGVGGVELFRQIYDFERDNDRGPLPRLPVPEDVTGIQLAREALVRLPFGAAAGTGRRAVRALQLGGRAVRSPSQAVNDVGKMLGSAQRVLGAPPAPPSPLLKRRGLGRRFEWVEFPLARFRAAAKSAGGSVNDAYISAICGALRRYHEALGVPVDAVPLAMPVNLRSDDDPAGGNHFAGARIAAPVGEPDPARRIQLIREKVLTAVGEPAINALSYAAPLLSRIPTPMLGALSSLTSTTDVQASNVPSFLEPPYLAGAKITKTLPFGPLPGVPMMIILVTEGGNCFVGVHYDTASVTDQELFARCLQDGFDEVLALDPERESVPTKGVSVQPAAPAGQSTAQTEA